MNSAVRSSFKEKFAKIRTYRSRKQYKGPTHKKANVQVFCFSAIQIYTK